MAGYSGTPLIVKLGLREDMVARFINAPAHYLELLGSIPLGVRIVRRAVAADFIHIFSSSASDLRKRFPPAKKTLKKNGLLWVSWPKGSSSLKADLNGIPFARSVCGMDWWT
jgi:hypothetical protein